MSAPPAGRRVSVVGNSGSGKSTVARAIATRLGVPWIELDSLYHQPGWTPMPEGDFRATVAEHVAADGWVIDGNYNVVRPLVWARADTVVWLDLPRRVVMRRVVARTLTRAVRRVELWNGNRERWRNLLRLDQDQSIIVWSWRQHGKYAHRYAAAMTHPQWKHLRFVRLRSSREVAAFLASLDRPARQRRDSE
jgi:adenylate kinase family enzyme